MFYIGHLYGSKTIAKWTQTKENIAKVSFIIRPETLLFPPTKVNAQTFFLCPLLTLTTTKNQASIFYEIQIFIERQRPESTNKKTTYDINVVKRFFISINETREIEVIPAEELNILVFKFLYEFTKEIWCRLRTFLPSEVNRYLINNNPSLNLFQDQQFSQAREVLLARKRDPAQQHAKGNRPQAARELTMAEEDLF